MPLGEVLRTLDHLLRLVIQHHQVPILELEPVQLVVRLLGVGDLVIDDKGRALGALGVAFSDLADRSELSEEVEEGRRINGVREVFDEENSVPPQC